MDKHLKFKFNTINKRQQILHYLILFLSLISLTLSYTTPSSCNNSTEYYNILTFKCTTCPNNNTQPSSEDKTFCNCTNKFTPNWDSIGFNHPNSCINLTGTFDKSSQVLSIWDTKGIINPLAITCSNTAKPNIQKNGCVNCGRNAKYNSTLKACQCTSGFIKIGQVCYQNKLTTSWIRTFTQNDPQNYLAQEQVIIGCKQENLIQQCNMLINLCVQAQYTLRNSFFCQLLSNLSTSSSLSKLPKYKFSSVLSDSIQIYASSISGVNTTSIKNQLQIIAIQYEKNGQIISMAPINKDLFECQLSEQDVVKFSSFGLNLYKSCSTTKIFDKQIYYDFYVKNLDGKYAQIPINIDGKYYKRISPSISSDSHNLKLQFISVPPLQVPVLYYSRSNYPIISTESNSSSITLSQLVPFIIFNVVIFIIFILVFYRHIQYNPSQQINDPYFICRGAVVFIFKIFYCWSYGLWIWLFGLSIYMFAFYKFQQTIFLILPDQQTQWLGYYYFFMVVYYIQLVFTILSIIKVIFDKSNVDYFMIDWEKQKDLRKFQVGKQKKQVSVWRKILIVNQLYKLSVKQNIDVYFITLFSLLFLKGLEWINLSYSIPNTLNLTQMSSTSSNKNVVLAYCIISFVFFIIGAVSYSNFYLIILIYLVFRVLIRIWNPLPVQDFVDLCAISNISIFIFNQALHGYYIHGVNPLGQSEGNLNYIQSIFQKQAKTFGKSRGFNLQDPEFCQTFEVVFPPHIRLAFQTKYKSVYLQKLIPQNYQGQSILSNPIPEQLSQNDYEQLQKISLNMVENFKIYLQSIKSSLLNIRDQTIWQKLINCPVSDLQNYKIPLFFKDRWNSFSNAFLSGHQFLFLLNYINLVNLFYIITQNIYFGAFIAIIINEVAFRIPAKFLMKRNISKNTLIDEKFFN